MARQAGKVGAGCPAQNLTPADRQSWTSRHAPQSVKASVQAD
jgi:hypothetical protein